MKIFLTGFPGSGKTLLGSQTARLLKIPFLDTDKMIEDETGETVSEIFRTKGENYFRQKESDVLHTLSSRRTALIATGGGLPCFGENMTWLNEHGLTVYLEASAAFLFHRLVREKKERPLLANLTDIELMIYITETIAGRRTFYEQSKLKVNAEHYTPQKLGTFLQKHLQ